MKAPGIPANEQQRLAVLRTYEILDTASEATFDRVTSLLACLLNVPLALVSLADADRLWFKSRVGLQVRQASRELSFCGHVVALDNTVVVNDATQDDRFFDNPAVLANPGVRFYAGAPLRSAEGMVLGTLCVADHRSRELDRDQLELLETLAAQVSAQLEVRRKSLELQARARELAIQRSFFDLSLDLLCTVNSSLHLEALNPAWEQVLGWSLPELRARPLTDFIHPQDAGAVQAQAHQLLQNNATIVNLEMRCLHREGRWIVLSWVAAARDGILFCVAHDMSAARDKQMRLEKTAAELARSEARLRSLFDGMAEGVLVFAEDGTIRSCNSAAEGILGLSFDQLTGRADRDPRWHCIHDDGSVVLNHTHPADETLRIGAPLRNIKMGVRNPGQKTKWISINTQLLPAGQWQDREVIATFRDITEQTEVSERLWAEQTQKRAIIDTAADAIVMIDEIGVIQWANPATQELFGYTQAELLGHNVNLLMPSDMRAAHDQSIVHYLITGEKRAIGARRELTAQRKDGSPLPIELSVGEFTLGGRRYFTGMIHDISERKQVERLQTEFISTVSHELRTPLTAIRGALGLVSAGVTGDLPYCAREYIDIALNNSDRLIRLINDLLDIEKMQSGKMNFRLKSMDLASVVRSAVLVNQTWAVSQQVSLIIVGDLPSGEVWADDDRMIQVLTNLISNAVKFSTPKSQVEVSMSASANGLRVSVRDHGPGIDAAFRARIFQRFSQADGSNTRHKEGTGLGLAISKEIIERMQGQIGFFCPDDGGTEFWFELAKVSPVAELHEQVLALPAADGLTKERDGQAA